MNAKILVRVGVMVVAMGVTLGLFQMSKPAHGQSETGVSSGPKVTVRVAETAWPNLHLGQSAVPLSGDRETGGAGRALASADFDEDGTPDLVTGYAGPQGGRLVVRRGNVDAIYPNSPEANARRARGEFSEAAFHPARGSFALAEAADFLGTGDFDADGHWDIVAAARGGTKLYWLRGDGRGNFAAAQALEVPGAITALAVGEVNRVDGLTDIALGVAATEGARVLVFESPGGALRGPPESFALAAPVVDLAFGALGEDGWLDLAIASGSEVVLVHGRDRKLSLDAEQQAKVGPAHLTQSGLEAAVVSIAIGDFAGDVNQELAVMTSNGVISLLNRDGTVAPKVTSAIGRRRVMAAKVSSSGKSDLLLLSQGNEMEIVAAPGRDATAWSVAGSLVTDRPIISVLPMRLNTSALSSLVVLETESGIPVVVSPEAAVTFTVNSAAVTDDAARGDGICADANGQCTLQAAIREMTGSTNTGPYTVNFNIPGGGVPVITGNFDGEISKPVTIDGTTQPGGRVEIAATSGFPIQFYGGNSVLRGVAIYGNSHAVILGSEGNVIEGNYIGIRADGSKPTGFGSAASGITISGHNNLVGGTTVQARNVISNCREPLSLSNTTGNIIRGNYVGTTIDGTAALPNGGSLNAGNSTVTVGGTAAGAGNVFAAATNQGTFSVGLNIGRASVIQGNKIGTTADGMQPLPMRGNALEVFTNEPVTIGGTTPAARNVLAASFWGIQVSHDSGEGTVIQGNYIGTNAAGTGALPNLEGGVLLSGTRGVVVGGAARGAGNLISGNGKNGLDLLGGINGTPCRGVTVQGNYIGTDASGTIALPNQESGFYLATTDNAKVGGTTAGERNLISGNTKHGLVVGNATANPGRIQGNFIGINIFGTGALGNRQHGIHIDNFGGHRIGGTEPGAGNIIAFNGGAGIASSFRDSLGGLILSNSIFANRGLGLDRSGDGVTPYRGDYSEAPVITSVSTFGSETVISGSLRTQTFGPQGAFTIQFFSNPNPDPLGYGEGQTFIGETTITAGQLATVPFSATIPAVPPGRYVSAVAIGVHDTQNNGGPLTSEFSFNARVAGESTPENTPLRLHLISPVAGGDNGSVTATIIGEGITQGATVVLRRAGQPDIIGENVVISADGSSLIARFNLRGRELGGWDAVVTNADGTTSTFTGGYTVEAGQGAQVWTDLLGRNEIRFNRAARFTVIFGNRGNTDAYMVPVWVAGIPKNAKVTLGFTLGQVPIPDVPGAVDPNQISPVIATATEQMLPVIIPVLRPGSGGTLQFTVEVPNGSPVFTLRSWSTPPLVKSITQTGISRLTGLSGSSSNGPAGISDDNIVTSDEGIECMNALFQAAVGCALGLIPGSDCARSVVGYTSNSVALNTGGDDALGWAQFAGGALGVLMHCVLKEAPGISTIHDLVSCGASFYSASNTCRDNIEKKYPVTPVESRDPNDKVGSHGSSIHQYVTAEEPFRYAIYFENVAAATAPAQDVVITDQLDVAKFDLNTFQLGAVSFGAGVVVAPPPGLSEWITDIDLRPAKDLIVRLIAGLDKTTGVVTWRFISLDATTKQPTEDPQAGFLPPNKNAPEGDGAVVFSIEAKPGQPTGTELRNLARIVFDTNPPINTPEWLNTIDNSPPASHVLPLALQNGSRIQVSWTGDDAGAGVAAYTIYVSKNGGPFEAWLSGTTLTSALFDANPGAIYEFYSVAHDGAGNRETAPTAGDASITVPIGQLQNISTRMHVGTDPNQLIGGFIVTGSEPKKVIVLATGPSLAAFGLTGVLEDPVLELYQGDTLIASNDNWKIPAQAEIEATGIKPSHDLESALVRTLAPGAYTAIVRGTNGTGVGTVQLYDLAPASNSKLANISSRGFVQVADDQVMIAGFIVGGEVGASSGIIVRAIAPSLSSVIPGVVPDPTLELKDANGSTLVFNDDWQQSPQAADISARGLAPSHAHESALGVSLSNGAYTAIVRGKGGATGVAVVEVYNVD
jgi:hypothetical protein